MLTGIISVNVGSIINNYYWGRTYTMKIIAAPYFAALTGIILNIVLIPRMGVSGATLSFSLMSVVWFIYQITWFLKDSGLRLHQVLVPRLSDVTHVMSRVKKNITGIKINRYYDLRFMNDEKTLIVNNITIKGKEINFQTKSYMSF